jgi:hypothetical protein
MTGRTQEYVADILGRCPVGQALISGSGSGWIGWSSKGKEPAGLLQDKKAKEFG